MAGLRARLGELTLKGKRPTSAKREGIVDVVEEKRS